MDSFDINALDSYMKRYKYGIVGKLETMVLNEKNISNQSDLVCMVLDYSPRVKGVSDQPLKYKLKNNNPLPDSSLKTTSNCSLNLEKANDDNNDESESSGGDNDDNSFSNSKSSSIRITKKNFNATDFCRELVDQIIDNVIIFERNTRNNSSSLLSKSRIRVYILNTKNFIEVQFKPEMNFNHLKKIIFNKLENAVNLNIHHHTVEAYEFRHTKDDRPVLSCPAIQEDVAILDLGEDTVCFVEKQNYIGSKVDGIGAKPKKLYGNVISSSEESKINLKIYIKLDINNISSTIIQIGAESTLRTVLEKVGLKKRLNYKNIELYFFVEHSESTENEDMDNAINMDIPVKYLSTFELDLYFKKFPDMPDYLMTNYAQSYRVYLNENSGSRKNKMSEDDENIHEFVFNDVSAGVYQEFEVIKINKYKNKQERTLGIDMYNLYNDMPKNKKNQKVGFLGFHGKIKNPLRKIKDVTACENKGEKSFVIKMKVDGEVKEVLYEVKSTNIRNEIVGKLQYLIRMNQKKK